MFRTFDLSRPVFAASTDASSARVFDPVADVDETTGEDTGPRPQSTTPAPQAEPVLAGLAQGEPVAMEEGETVWASHWACSTSPRPDGACWSPWQSLRVDPFGRSTVCCSFFEKLPEFEFPTARDFHSTTGMWNHPFMQRLRTTMGTNERIPFCSFCLGSVPPGASAQEAKRAAMRDSQRIYQLIAEEAARIDFSPAIDALPEDLVTWVWDRAPQGSGLERPFRKARWEYRREIRKRGFWELGDILQLGADRVMSTPFLREANESLVLADVEGPRRAGTEALAAALGAPIRVETPTKAPFVLPFADGSFDGVWLQGGWLGLYGRDAVLAEARRVLRTGGRLQINAAPGLGAVLDRALNGSPRRVAGAMKALERGDNWSGRGGYLAERTLSDVLERAGFATDSARPPNVRRINGRYRERAPAVSVNEELLRRLRDPQARAALASKDGEFWSGMEATISVSALAAGARRPKSVGMPIAVRRSAATALGQDARARQDA